MYQTAMNKSEPAHLAHICFEQNIIYFRCIAELWMVLKFLLRTSRVYCSKRRDHTGSFQSQHSSKRDIIYMAVSASLL